MLILQGEKAQARSCHEKIISHIKKGRAIYGSV